MVTRLLLLILLLSYVTASAQKRVRTDVLVIGGGAGGTAAGIQSARLGVKTVIVEATPWLGGMLSAAGVSAIDGNHQLPSGIWSEFRNHLYKRYGGPSAVQTGWVSNTLFEPHVGDSIFKKMAEAEKNLHVIYQFHFSSLVKKNNRIESATFTNEAGELLVVEAKVFIDATELGDVIKAAGLPYDLGMEAGSITGEKAGITVSSNIIQDLTYVAVLKDYGAGSDKTIPRPVKYDPAEFDGSCTDYYHDKSRPAPSVDAKKMLEYGKLPNNKYMLNWPIYGNDTYLNVVEMTETQRRQALEKAKETTLRFIYFIQHQLGFKHLGLADDEFPTADRLALMPYHREGRRVKGLVRFNMRHIAEPFTYGDPLYRTGISVGDYPIDHHHKKNPGAPQHLDFYPVPSYNVPLGALIPAGVHNLVIAEKGISVSNVANGTTRLQPCVLLTGQAAGVLSALSVRRQMTPAKVPVRAVQQALLQAKAYIMPYIDVQPGNPHFEAIQKTGATGILRGTGIPYKWANQTWFYPDSLVDAKALAKDLGEFQQAPYTFSGRHVTLLEAMNAIRLLKPSVIQPDASVWKNWGLKNFDLSRHITRLELAVLLQNTIDPFSMKAVNHKGVFAR
jgi:hypothetical protein